jgi:ABC-2 type transport system ATP-binding protein
VLQATGLTKRFPVRRPLGQVVRHPFAGTRQTVVDDVSLHASAGEFLGLLGPNGAGKTTLLKMLATLVLPDEGGATIEGHDLVRDAARIRSLVAPCLAQERSLYLRLTARQNLEVFADLQGVERSARSARVAEVLAAVALTDTGEKLVGQFSSGMLQRLLIARALLTRPRLLLLDEPTRSLDPLSARTFRRFLRDELVARGCAVILATHNAEEAFELCDRVGVLHRGRLLASGVARELARRYLGVRYTLVTDRPDHHAFGELASLGVLAARATEDRADGEWREVALQLDPGSDPSSVLAHLTGRGVRVAAFSPAVASLAELIEGVTADGGPP